MNKKDIFAPLIIGEACAIIFVLISDFLQLPEIITQYTNFFPIILPALALAGTWFVWMIGKKLPTVFQMGKNLLTGILNTFIDLGILNLLMWVFKASSGWAYVVFKSVSFFGASINSYYWNKFWTFEKKETKAGIKEFSKFFTVALGGLLIHILVSSVIVNVIKPQFGIDPKLWANLGAIASTVFAFAWDFLGYKLIVFKK